MNLLFIILDGVGDISYSELDKKTPLESAKTPNLDVLTKKSKTGIMYPIKGIAPESDESTLALLGYDPFKEYTGRGPLEALGVGLNVKDVILRCNYAKYSGNKITEFQYHPDKKQLIEFQKKLNKIDLGIDFEFKNTFEYRSVLILKGNLSPLISNTHPGYKIVKNHVTSAIPRPHPLKIKKSKALIPSREAKRTAKIVNDFVEKSKTVLGNNRIILTRGAGNAIPRIKKLNRNWALFGDTPVELAIGKVTGMSVLGCPKNTRDAVKKIKSAFKKYNSIYIELKNTDHWSHRGDPLKKKEAIEEIDKNFISEIKKLKDTVICITADHSTPCKYLAHSKHPVPVLIYSEKIKGDLVKRFTENACKKGSIGTIEGKQLMSIIRKELK